ncbi:thioesterase II family protein [Streptomyces sp. NPDC059215]|uniref:thioesterase II family protein n=1 Tax=Streptomyces sp. NPDC059215 TaxID=3346772 RepID=UPI003698D89A
MRSHVEEQWLRSFRDGDEGETKLVCFPHAGGVTGAYRTWSTGLPSDIDVMAVRYPGREERFDDPFPPGLEDLADDIAEALAELTQHRLVLFGHCMGGWVAYEVALRLQQQGRPPAALCVSGRRPPHEPAGSQMRYGSDEDIIAHAVSLDAGSSAVFENPDLREAVLPAIRADYRLTEEYSGGPRPQLHCPIYGYAGEDDPEMSPEEMRGWADITDYSFRLRVLPGGHFYLKSEEATLLPDLRKILDSVKFDTATFS